MQCFYWTLPWKVLDQIYRVTTAWMTWKLIWWESDSQLSTGNGLTNTWQAAMVQSILYFWSQFGYKWLQLCLWPFGYGLSLKTCVQLKAFFERSVNNLYLIWSSCLWNAIAWDRLQELRAILWHHRMSTRHKQFH